MIFIVTLYNLERSSLRKLARPLPDGYINHEWEKELTVEQSMLTAEDLKEITEKGFRYFNVKIDIAVKNRFKQS